MAKLKMVLLLCIISILPFLSGCELLLLGAGQSATSEDTGFLKSYEGLQQKPQNNSSELLPDLWYVSPNAKIDKYKKVVVTDFTSMTKNPRDLSGLQMREYKTLRQDMADHLAEALDGTVFSKTMRLQEKIVPQKDASMIHDLKGDAVLIGNIKGIISLGGLTATQIEVVLIDIKTGEEVVKAIHRGLSDPDKVSMVFVGRLTSLINKAKNRN